MASWRNVGGEVKSLGGGGGGGVKSFGGEVKSFGGEASPLSQ